MQPNKHCNSGNCTAFLKSPQVQCPMFLTLSNRYGFDYGSAHFVLMSTEHFFDPTSPQYQFLEMHLSSVNRTRTPWLIFAGHRQV